MLFAMLSPPFLFLQKKIPAPVTERGLRLCGAAIHYGKDAPLCQNFVDEQPPLLRPVRVQLRVRSAVRPYDRDRDGFCVPLAHIFGVQNPLPVYLMLDSFLVQDFVQRLGAHIVIGGDLRSCHCAGAGM